MTYTYMYVYVHTNVRVEIHLQGVSVSHGNTSSYASSVKSTLSIMSVAMYIVPLINVVV